MKGTTMADTPMPITGFSMDAMESPDGQTMVAVLTLQTGELTFEFAINEEGAKAMARNLQQFLNMVQSSGGRPN
jgi:type IV secretory pathway VirB4 component